MTVIPAPHTAYVHRPRGHVEKRIPDNLEAITKEDVVDGAALYMKAGIPQSGEDGSASWNATDWSFYSGRIIEKKEGEYWFANDDPMPGWPPGHGVALRPGTEVPVSSGTLEYLFKPRNSTGVFTSG